MPTPRGLRRSPRNFRKDKFDGDHVNNFPEFCDLVEDMIHNTGVIQEAVLAAVTNDVQLQTKLRRTILRTIELKTTGSEYVNAVTAYCLRAAAYCQENGVFNPFDNFLDIVEEMDEPEPIQFYLDLANANDDPLQNIEIQINDFHAICDDFESVQVEILRRENEEKVSQAVSTEKARADSAVDALAAAGVKSRSSCFSMPAVEVNWIRAGLLFSQIGWLGWIALCSSVIPPALKYADIQSWYSWWSIAFILVVFIVQITNMCIIQFLKFIWSNIKQLFDGLIRCCLRCVGVNRD